MDGLLQVLLARDLGSDIYESTNRTANENLDMDCFSCSIASCGAVCFVRSYFKV